MRRVARNVKPLAHAISFWHRSRMEDGTQDNDKLRNGQREKGTDSGSDKAERLRVALRENLRRRKQQARDSGRAARNGDKPE